MKISINNNTNSVCKTGLDGDTLIVKDYSDNERGSLLPPFHGPIELFLVPASAPRLV